MGLVGDQSVSSISTCSYSWKTEYGLERARKKKPAVSSTDFWWICWLLGTCCVLDATWAEDRKKWKRHREVGRKERREGEGGKQGTDLSAVWRQLFENEEMLKAQSLVTRHMAPFAFTKMILYLSCATQGKHLYTQIITCIASCLFVYLGSNYDV